MADQEPTDASEPSSDPEPPNSGLERLLTIWLLPGLGGLNFDLCAPFLKPIPYLLKALLVF